MVKERNHQRNQRAWELYTLHNMTQQQIADTLELSVQRISQILAEVRAELPQETREDTIARRRAQIDAVISGHLPAAATGDKDATLSLVKLWERESKYLQLDAPTRQEVTATVAHTEPEVLDRIRAWKQDRDAEIPDDSDG